MVLRCWAAVVLVVSEVVEMGGGGEKVVSSFPELCSLTNEIAPITNITSSEANTLLRIGQRCGGAAASLVRIAGAGG